VRKSNLKAVPTEKPEPLTYEQVQRLTRGIADSAIEDEWLLGALMVFTREIIEHCHDKLHVETVAMLLEDHLYAVTSDFDRAQERYIAAKREGLLKGGAR